MKGSLNLLYVIFFSAILFTSLGSTTPVVVRGDDDDDDDDLSDKDVIQICCTWGYELADGILTYSFDDDDVDDDVIDAVKNAISSWNDELTGISLVETDDGNEDIKISFKNDGKKIAGKTVNYFDGYGFIRQSHITVSEESYNRDFSSSQIEQIALHEMGHVLGLDHANFKGNLMTERVDIGSPTISSCEIEGVNIANAWKINGGNTMYLPVKQYIEC